MKHINTGKVGEDIAERFLVKHGYSVVERNYSRKWGELDIICRNQNGLHFVEVKTVSRETDDFDNEETYRPEDNVHKAKQMRLMRAIQTYLTERDIQDEWYFHVITVKLDKLTKRARVDMIADVILGA